MTVPHPRRQSGRPQAAYAARAAAALILSLSPALANASAPDPDRRDAEIDATIRLAQAAEDAERSTPPERAEAERPAAQPKLTADEIVRAIKLRAQKELARRRARKWSLTNMATWTLANESNPGLIKARASALYTEEYWNTTFSYKLVPELTWQLGYSLDALHYREYTDGSTFTNTLNTKLIYRFAKPWRIEAHYTFDDSDYPYDDGASTHDQKVHLRLRQSFLKRCYHYVGWTYLNKQYKAKNKRESDTTRIEGKGRKDQRHTGTYEIGGTFADANTLKLRQEFYFNDSNEGYQDNNDAQDYKVKVSFLRDWTKQWSSSSNFTYELKRYEARTVSERGVAQQDYTKTYDAGLTCKISPQVDLAYTWKYKQNDSNDTGQAYQDITNSLALTGAF